MLSVGLSQGTAPLLGYYYGKKDSENLSKAMRISIIYGVILGTVFTALLFVSNRVFAGVFLTDEKLIKQTAWFLRLLCFHAPLLGIINMVTAYFQALGKAINSLIITILRNAVLFIPGVIIMNAIFKLNGVILNQLVVELLLTVICMIMYAYNNPKKLFFVSVQYPHRYEPKSMKNHL